MTNGEPNFDRLLKVLWGEQPDRVPFFEFLVDEQIIEAFTGQPVPQWWRIKDREKRKKIKKLYLKQRVEFYRNLGYDCVPLEVGLRLRQTNYNISHSSEPLGRTNRVWVDNYQSTIANAEEFESFPWPPVEKAVDFEFLELAREFLPENMKLVAGVGGGVQEHVLWLLGMRQFSISVRKEPSFIENLFNKIGSLILESDKIIGEMDHVGCLRMGDDLGYKKKTMLNPVFLRKHVFPWYKRIVDAAHKNNKPFLLHSCGNLDRIMDDLIDYAGIDAWHSFQDNVLSVIKAKEKYGSRVAIMGGIDVEILSSGSIKEVKEYTTNVLRKCMVGGGYALGSGNSITNYVKIENYKAMLEIGRKFGKY